MKAKIDPALAGLAVSVDDLKPHPRNARQGDVGALTLSLRRFGQVRPVLVQRSTGFVVAGNHVLAAARALGWREVAAAVVDMDDDQALAYLVADNRLSALGYNDDSALVSILTDLAQRDLLDGTGYDGDAVDDLLRTTGLMAGGGDPGASILDAFADAPKSDRNELGLRNGRDAAGNDYVALNLPLTAAQRDLWLRAVKKARTEGHETQPAALEALCRAYLED